MNNAIYADIEAAVEPAAVVAAAAGRGSRRATAGETLSVEGVSAAYHGRPTLFDVSCVIPARRVSAVMGPSGCGKSTFLKILNRSLELTPGARVTSGRVWLGGEDIYARSDIDPLLRRRVGLVLQHPVIFPMSIRENVLFGARFHRLCRRGAMDEWCEEHLRGAGLWDEVKDRLRDPATRLSIGQQQRLCIARALANRPEILLMDEPCSALDPRSSEKVEELIAYLKERFAIVIVTHNLGQARRVGDRALFFYAGR
ncbi:MAG: phosphate ABC transporter ATP-binding protein, partial [Planctomycetota bacterium]|nr:phosphate ABC transporter ATP-binding protein [Planctomycetota bacterium]